MKKIKDYEKTKTVIHCKTQDEAKKINELIVLNGGRDLNDMFNTYKENTCYLLDLPLNTYSNLNYFKKNNYTIYPALDFLEEIIPEYVEYTDLIEDKFYVALIERKLEWNSIFKSKGKLEFSYRLYLDNSEFKNDTGTWNINNVIFRKATEDEIKWIEACIDANKLISKDEALKVKEKPEFIVGKWYKYNCENIYYLKCNKFNNNKPNKIYYSEYINCKNSNHNKQIGEFENEYVTHEEISLEEIQKYLPDGHPDKIVKEFVLPENWCIKITEENKVILNKYLIDNKKNYSDYLDTWNVYSSTRSNYFYSKSLGGAHSSSKLKNNFTLITFEQFKRLVLKENTLSVEIKTIKWTPESNSLELPYKLNQIIEPKINTNNELVYEKLVTRQCYTGKLSLPILKKEINLQIIKIN